MNNWKRIKIGDMSTSCLGKMLDKNKNKGVFQPYLSNKDVKWGYFNLDDLRMMRFEESENDRYGLLNGDLIVCEGGEPGRCAIWRNQTPNMKLQKALHRVRVNKNFSSEFLHYSIIAASQIGELQKHFIGSTIKHLTGVGLKNIELPFPNFNTQKKIAKVLSDLDAKIELNNKINDELEALAKLIYDYWFVQFDFPNEQGKPYKSSGGKMVWNKELKREIPEGWEVKMINDVIEVKDGTHDSPKPKGIGYRLITSKNLKPEGLDFENANLISEEDFENINKRSKVDSGDILFSMIGSIGVVYKVEESEINFAIKNVALYKTSQSQNFKNYTYQYLRSYDMQRYKGNVISGSIQKFIGLGALRNMPLLFNEEVIRNFTDKTEHVFLKLDSNKKQNQQLSSLRDWLLPMLMNGQVSVKEAEERLGMAAEQSGEYKKN